MDVYMVPTGAGRYELYCEAAAAPAEDDEAAPQSGIPRVPARWFRQLLADFERERQRPRDDQRKRWTNRAWRWTRRHAAEVIAEQRLLWRLRRQTCATLIHPDDLDGPGAHDVARRVLARDRDRHRFWLIVDALIAAITGPLFFFVPGPNLVAYYFAFRTVGHFFSWRGARRGLDVVRWHLEASAALGELRAVLALPAAERPARIRDIERRLRLSHLAGFFDRVAVIRT
jgi:hypothetical protein